MTEYRFIEPLDVLHLRGNRLFGEGGNGGQAQMPPWPSVFAGALRSHMLARAGVNPAAFGREASNTDGALALALGTPSEPGTFTLETLTLARTDGHATEPLFAMPGDIEVFAEENGDAAISVHRQTPVTLPEGITASVPLARAPVLQRSQRGKAETGYWLTAQGWARYLLGQTPDAAQCVHHRELWSVERRLGIELDSQRGSTVEGQLYTTDAVRLATTPQPVGFLAGIGGADDEIVPEDGVLRLGGDGRGAAVNRANVAAAATADFATIESSRRFRIILTAPGIFPNGWRLPGLTVNDIWRFPGGQARLVAAAVPRGGVISGWDLVKRHPKPAERVAPAGAVYWFENLEGEADALRKLADHGLWNLSANNDNPARRAEGFNRFAIANA